MAVQISTNKANLFNKMLLSFSYPLKHTRYNLCGGTVWIWGRNLSKAALPFSSVLAVLWNSLISPHQWCSTEKSRLPHCQALRVPVLFDSVFCGSLDSPSFFLQHPKCPFIVCPFYYSPNLIQGGFFSKEVRCWLKGG